MKNTTLHPLKWKWTGPIYKNGINGLIGNAEDRFSRCEAHTTGSLDRIIHNISI